MKTSWHIGHFGIPLLQVSQRLCPLVQRLMGGDIYSIHTGHSISFSVTSSVLDIPISLASTGPSDLQRKLQHCQQVQLSADVTCEVFMTMMIHAASAGYDTVYSGSWVPRGVGRLERVVGPPPEALSNRRQNKYFKQKKITCV